jgi:putative membrane protein
LLDGWVSVPYCGIPTAPDALWTRWNLDPILMAALVALAGLYALGATRLGHGARIGLTGLSRREQAAFYCGWTIAAVAVVSPLCALSVSLFSARVGQHMLLVLVAAPLVAAGRPVTAFAAVLMRPDAPERSRQRSSLASPLIAAACFAVLLWFWHAPGPYAATFSSTFVYWSMHVSLFGAALWLWGGLDRTLAGSMRVVGAGVISSVQMGFLGVLITLAPRAIYTPHALTTAAWGLTPLQDQQLGGAIMWVPGCVVFLMVSMLALGSALADQSSARTSRPTPLRVL